MQMERADSFWSYHIPTALISLRFTTHKLFGLPLFVIMTGQAAVPPSHLLEGGVVEDLDEDSSGVDRYAGWVCARI